MINIGRTMKILNMINSLMITEKDSIAVAIEALKEGDIAKYKISDKIKEIQLAQDIPIYHKFSVINIKEGELVYKYGEVIGKAIKNIKIGQHVHNHNIISIREAIEG